MVAAHGSTKRTSNVFCSPNTLCQAARSSWLTQTYLSFGNPFIEKLFFHVPFLLEPWRVYALADSGMASTEATFSKDAIFI